MTLIPAARGSSVSTVRPKLWNWGSTPNIVFGGEKSTHFHSFGLTVLTLLPWPRGSRSFTRAKFLPPRIIRLIRQHRPTVFIAIPSMYGALLHAKDAGPRIQVLPVHRLRGASARRGFHTLQGYGSA